MAKIRQPLNATEMVGVIDEHIQSFTEDAAYHLQQLKEHPLNNRSSVEDYYLRIYQIDILQSAREVLVDKGIDAFKKYLVSQKEKYVLKTSLITQSPNIMSLPFLKFEDDARRWFFYLSESLFLN